jgi:hypothetical protein
LPAEEGSSIDWICGNVTFGKMGCITGKHIDEGIWEKIGSEVLAAVAVNSIVLYDVTPCGLPQVYLHSGGISASIFRIEETIVKQPARRKQQAKRNHERIWFSSLMHSTE